MPSDAIDFRHRAELTELTEKIDEPCSRDQLRACLRDLACLNRWFLGYRPVLQWLNTVAPLAAPEPLHIVDVGCGYGDTLRRIDLWARTRGVAVELTGLDLKSRRRRRRRRGHPIGERNSLGRGRRLSLAARKADSLRHQFSLYPPPHRA
jgi:SAM-dependent methyltransferase